MRRSLTAALVMSLVAVAGCGGGAEGKSAEPKSDYYRGKTIKILVPFAPGGSSDVVARLVARELPANLPGKPTIVVENLPGGGGAIAFQRLARGKSDALTIGVATSGNVLRHLLKEPGHDYPLETMPLIGAVPGTDVTVVRSAIAKDLDSLLKVDDVVTGGNTAPGSQLALVHQFGTALWGLKLKQVFGFEGIGDVATALERKEVDMATPTDIGYIPTYKPLVDSGKFTAVWQDGVVEASGEITRAPAVPDIPTLHEEYKRIKGTEPSGVDWDAYRILVATGTVASALFAHADTDPKHVKTLRDAFQKMAASPEWAAQTQKSFSYQVAVASTEAGEAALKEINATEPEVVKLLQGSSKK
jgi:tripartite-type tricarboxylate transporter receptor subunit TctC